MNTSARFVTPASRLALVIALAGSALAFAPAPAAIAQPDRAAAAEAARAAGTLPVRRITLYRSGVGYFLRAGQVDGTQRVSLQFDASQINDVLKSLQVLDKSGGRVDAVSYSSKDPLSRRLGSFAVQIGDNPSLATLLERLRGSPVTIETSEGNVAGDVLSVETRRVAAPGSRPGDGNSALVDTAFVNLLTDGGMQSIAIPQVRSFKIADEMLAKDLNKALSALAESRAERVKNVDVQLSGTGTRDIAVAYVHETPVWKTSYRLILPESDAGSPGGDRSMLQGWAIVENTTDNDWTDVRLALVSGRPVSFQMDLYEPLYLARPMIPVPTVPGVMPRAYEGGSAPQIASAGRPMPAPASPPAEAMKRAARPGSRGPGGGVGGSAGSGEAGAPGSPDTAGNYASISASDMADYAPKSAATGGEVGEQFQFELDAPVTIERQRSAMIPILSSPVGGKRVSIYNQADRPDHPMRGVQLTNDTSLQLLPGPISVYDGPAYAGDAQINQISVGDKRLLAYAVDLDVTVTTKPIDAATTTKVRIIKGAYEVTQKVESGTVYEFSNKDLKRGRTLIVEHPRLPGWELTSPSKPDEKSGIEQTQSQYRFPLDMAAGKAASLTVKQERIERQSIGIDSFDMETLARWSAEGKLSDAVIQAVREMQRRRQAVAEAERVVEQTDRQLNTLRAEQSRITGMLSSLDRQTDAYKNLLTKVNTQEKQIDTLSAGRDAQVAEVDKRRAELEKYVNELTVE